MTPRWTEYETSTELRAALVANARTYIGCRYRHQGRTRAHGLDCLGLLIANARDFGFAFGLMETDDAYSLVPDSDYFVSRLSEEMVVLPDWRAALPADVLLTRWQPTNPPTHLGLVALNETDNVVCVHSSRQMRRVVDNRWDREDLITHAFRIREVAELMGREGAN